MMTRRTNTLLVGVATLALLATAGTASALPIIMAGTNNPGPVTPLDLGTGAGTVGNPATITNPGDDISTITFSGGDASKSGLYSGSLADVVASPYPNGPANVPPISDANYLVAENNGSVTITFKSPQTTLDLLWGTVDNSPNPTTYNLLTFDLGGVATGDTLDGDMILPVIGNPASGGTNAWVELSGLMSFDSVTFSASNVAFEFNVGTPTPTPEPGSLALFGIALAGLGFLSRRRRNLA